MNSTTIVRLLLVLSPTSPLTAPPSSVEGDWHLPFLSISHIHTADEIITPVHVGDIIQYSQMNDSRRDQRVCIMARPYYQLSFHHPLRMQLTRISLKPNFPTVSLSYSSISDTSIPELPDTLFYSLTNISLSIYDPDPVVRVECYCHEDGVWIWFAL